MARDSADELEPSRHRSSGGLVQLLGVRDVAAVLGVADRYVYRLVSERRIPFIKCGHYVRFDPDEIRWWLDDARIAPTVPPSRHRPRG